MSENVENSQNDFISLGIDEETVKELQSLGIEKPTEVQKKIIPEISKGKSLLFQSETGTGKTLTFLLPTCKKIDAQIKNPQVIIVTPTHELSAQIKSELAKISDYKASLCFGGSVIKRQIESLKEKPQFIIGSCVRIKELIFLKKIKLSDLKVVIFDEISPEKLLVEIAPDIHAKGADYTIETLPEAKAIMEVGGKIEFIDFVEGKSTTNVINKMRS